MQAKRKGLKFDALDRPFLASPMLFTGVREDLPDEEREQVGPEEHEAAYHIETQKGKFF